MTVTPDALDALPLGTIIAARTWPTWAGPDDDASLETLRWERVSPTAELADPTWTSHKLPWAALDYSLDGDRRGATSADLLEHGGIEVLAVPFDAMRPALEYVGRELTKFMAHLAGFLDGEPTQEPDELADLLERWDADERPEGWNAGDEHHLAASSIEKLRP
jgi:hypothetical protein